MTEEGIIFHLGLLSYSEAWELQHRLWTGRVEKTLPDMVVFLEHPHTITLGRLGNRTNLLASPELLESLGVPVIHVERGGDITYHGPGQAVVYPIFHFYENGFNMIQFVEKLEDFVIRILRDYSIEGRRKSENRGVWVGDDKIASIGLAVRQKVSFHGLALNYNTDLKFFEMINPCGLKNTKMTSISTILHKKISSDDLYEKMIFHFRNSFEKNWRILRLSEAQDFLRKMK
ncbi:MAG: lipoyl(octanoyl) transferase LipB [Syntrophales bacterium]